MLLKYSLALVWIFANHDVGEDVVLLPPLTYPLCAIPQYQHQAKTFEGGTPAAAARWQHHHEQHHSSSVVEQPRTAQQQSTIRQQWILLKCELEFEAVLE